MKKRLWEVILTIAVVAQIGIVLFVISSAKPGEAENKKTEATVFPSVFSSVDIPDTVYFAGELVPVERFDIAESLDRELLVNSYFHSQTIRVIKLAPRFFPVIEPILKQYGIPEDFKYLAVAESALDPTAVSYAGAKGFWQFMEGTAMDFGLEVNSEVDERYHVEKSTVAACKYLNKAYQRYGNWAMVAASYNGGMRGIDRQAERQKINNYYDLLFVSETQRYVYRIIAFKLIMENPEKFNFYIPEKHKYPLIQTKNVEISGPINNFADFAHSHGINYKLLKEFNPWLRDSYLTNTKGKKYTLRIPILNKEEQS